jgi:hypothetical protein
VKRRAHCHIRLRKHPGQASSRPGQDIQMG